MRRANVCALVALLALACGSPAETPDSGGAVDANESMDTGLDTGSEPQDVGVDANLPPGARGPSSPPTLGTQIDRMGRPAISTATLGLAADNATRDALRDDYTAASDPTTWASTFAAPIESSIALLDGVDTVCGNQLLAGPTADASRYDVLAGLLADDRLWLRTTGASSVYLAVEANAVGILPNTDGGGRRPSFDVIDQSYSVLIVGALSGVGDGVAPDADTMGTTFPYLAAPH